MTAYMVILVGACGLAAIGMTAQVMDIWALTMDRRFALSQREYRISDMLGMKRTAAWTLLVVHGLVASASILLVLNPTQPASISPSGYWATLTRPLVSIAVLIHAAYQMRARRRVTRVR